MRIKIISLFIVLVALIAGGAFFLKKDNLPIVRSEKGTSWYAVHLNNGQVYFGHMVALSADTIALSETYFLEAYQEADTALSQSKNFAVTQTPKQIYRLVSRGGEKTLATDHTLYINRAAVLFWEKLTAESDVVSLINKEKK